MIVLLFVDHSFILHKFSKFEFNKNFNIIYFILVIYVII